MRQLTATKFRNVIAIWNTAPPQVKQKCHASADFLGVLIVSNDVVGGCCIPTTIFGVRIPVAPSSVPQKHV
jgi:hypothetical protein